MQTQFCNECQHAELSHDLGTPNENNENFAFSKCAIAAIESNHAKCKMLITKQRIQAISQQQSCSSLKQLQAILRAALKFGCFTIITCFSSFCFEDYAAFCKTKTFRETHGYHLNDMQINNFIIETSESIRIDILFPLLEHKMYDIFFANMKTYTDEMMQFVYTNQACYLSLLFDFLPLQDLNTIETLVETCPEMRDFLLKKIAPALLSLRDNEMADVLETLQDYQDSIEQRKAYASMECNVLPTDVVKHHIHCYF